MKNKLRTLFVFIGILAVALILPCTAIADEQTQVNQFVVTNDTEETGAYTVTLSKNGEVYDTQSTELLSGESITITVYKDTIPNVPSDLVASAVSESQIGLSWVDSSNIEQGFKVERDGIEIASLSANVVSYSDIELSPSTSYCYKVRAYNNVGYSGFSNESCAMTLAQPIEYSTVNFNLASKSQVFTHQYGLYWCCVGKVNGVLYMLYNHGTAQYPNICKIIGLAKSTDDGLTWQIVNDNYLPESSGWEGNYVEAHSIVPMPDGSVRIYYGGQDGSHWRIGFATTNPDNMALGVSPVKYSGNPVFNISPTGWDSTHVADPHVCYWNGQYHLYYCAMGSVWQVGHATSPDGIIWARDPANPVIARGASGTWNYNTAAPGYILTFDGYILFLSGGRKTSPCDTVMVGAFKTIDGTHFTPYVGNPILGSIGDCKWEGHIDLVRDGINITAFYSAEGITHPIWRVTGQLE